MQATLLHTDIPHLKGCAYTTPTPFMETSTAGQSPPLAPIAQHRSGTPRRSLSPLAAHPDARESQRTASASPSQPSLSTAEVTNTPPQRQSTQPRATSSPLVSLVNGAGDAESALCSSSGVPAASGMPALLPTAANAAAGAGSSRPSSSGPPAVGPDTVGDLTNSCAPDGAGCHPTETHGGGGTAAMSTAAGKAGKRAQKAASSTHGSRRQGSTGGVNGGAGGAGQSSSSGSSSGGASRSASARCKAARTLAAELMSALMERPPHPTQIAQYRLSMRSSAAAMAGSAADAPSRESAAGGSTTKATASSTGTAAAAAATPSSTPSFLEAVRNGRHKAGAAAHPAPAASLPVPVTASAKGTATPPTSMRSGGTPLHGPLPPSLTSPSPPLPPSNGSTQLGTSTAPASSSTGAAGEHAARRPLELMPDDAANIPRLLAVLREIALSCASLDALGKTQPVGATSAATPPPPPHEAAAARAHVDAQQSSSGGGGSVHHSGSASGTSSSTSVAVAASTRLHRELNVGYEEQWQRVCAHLDRVRELVLNEQELVSTLDETLGAEWRAAPSLSAATGAAAAEAGARGEVAVTEASLLVVLPTNAAVTGESTAAAVAVDAVVPVMPTPVDHEVATEKKQRAKSPTNTSSSGGGTNGAKDRGVTSAAVASTAATTTASTSQLNHNARPFQSRSPPTFAAPQPHLSHSPPLSTAAVQSRRGSSAAGHHAHSQPQQSSANPVSSSMKQLSESSSTYSPSQHVTTYLERTTPPASGRLVEDGPSGGGGGGGADTAAGGGGLLNFPSTPLSEAAVPYQPSTTLIGGTSPRGGNASVSSSSTPFHLESREEMLRRRSAAPNAFYASMTHSGATHYLGGPPSAATTPGTFVPSSVPPGSPAFALPHSGARSMPVSPLLSYGSPVVASACPYDYLLVLDFEATCEEHPPPNYLYEIIEFPVVVVDVRLQRVVAEFHRFVRPRHKVALSRFCRELTGMRQEDVDTAAPLEEVILQFERWFAHTVPPHARCVFATDGPMDMREFMYHHSVSRQGIRFPPLFYQYIDVKHTFACFFQCSQGKIKAMLEVLNLPFEGRLHSGLDDARNIASIVIGLLQYGCSFCEVPLNRLPLNGLLLSGAANASGSGTAPLTLPPSTATTAGSGRHRGGGAAQTYITAPYSVDEDDYSY